MSTKLAVILCILAVARAGIIGTDYSPTTAVSYSAISTPTIATIQPPKDLSTPLVYSKTYSPPPYYESVLTTQESKLKNEDGSENTIYSKSLNTAYADVKKYESHIANGDDYAQHFPTIYSTGFHENPYVYHPATYNFGTPVVHAVATPTFAKSVPVYTAQSIPITKSKTTKVITPLYTKTKVVTTGVPAYSSHSPILVSPSVKTALTYSDAPLVSHMSFSGLGASYGW